MPDPFDQPSTGSSAHARDPGEVGSELPGAPDRPEMKPHDLIDPSESLTSAEGEETVPTPQVARSSGHPLHELPMASEHAMMVSNSLSSEHLAPAPLPRDMGKVGASLSAYDSQPPRSSSGALGRILGLPPTGTAFPDSVRPSYLFLGVVAALSLFADISTKVWAEIVINQRGLEPINIIGDNFNITLAYNQGGAWGLFASADKMVRLPFFLAVSVFAIFFIVSLYSRLAPSQRALKWGLPMVLGGALGNLSDRITRSQVIDFIDYRADWVMHANAFVAKYVKHWAVTDHWPTFNVADIAICVGVGLMGVDMITHRHRAHPSSSGGQGPGLGSADDSVATDETTAAHSDVAPAQVDPAPGENASATV